MNWGRWILINTAVIVFLVFDLNSGDELPSQAVALLHYVFIALALLGLIGSVFMYLSQKRGREAAARVGDMVPKGDL